MLLATIPGRRWRVVCSDNVIRHEVDTFDTLAEARHWADTGHACLAFHVYHEVAP